MIKKISKIEGFTLIEALTMLFIFSLITVTFYNVLSLGTRYIQDAKNRLGAVSLANEKMEIIRNLQYDSIGTVGGTVSGDILQNENVAENTRQYSVHAEVIYEDDPLDGLAYSDTVWFEDYKKVTITVSWDNGLGSSQNVQLVSRFVPPGLEVEKLGDGILSINIFSDQPGGSGIPNSSVHIVNTETGLDTTQTTDSTGNVILMGDTIKNSIQKYQITVTKSGYETASTFPPYPATSYNPTDVHASVVTGSINVANIVQDKLGNLKISTSDYLSQPLGNINFSLLGGRKLGTEADSPFDPVYNFNQDSETGSSGEKDFGSVSPGQYTLTFPTSVTDGYSVIGEYPISAFTLFSDQNLDFEIKLAAKNKTSLMVKVLSDQAGNPPVSGAEVKLSNTGYDNTLTTGDDGIVFFPSTSDVFQSGTYDLKITSSEFQENNSQVIISNGELKTETVGLTSL